MDEDRVTAYINSDRYNRKPAWVVKKRLLGEEIRLLGIANAGAKRVLCWFGYTRKSETTAGSDERDTVRGRALVHIL